MDAKLHRIYYSPKGYWRGLSAIDKLSEVAKVSKNVAKDWLKKQAIWQVYLPPPKYIPRKKFDISIPNEMHQADLLFLPHDKVGRKTYKYALTVIDVASRYKAAMPLTTKNSSDVAKALAQIYKRGSLLKWPKVFRVDPGKEFMGEVNILLNKHNVTISRGIKDAHRSQAFVERFNKTLSERLFGYQYAVDLHKEGKSVEWVRRLPLVVNALNHEETRLIGKKPIDAIKQKTIVSQASAPLLGKDTLLPYDIIVRYLYQPGELEKDQRSRATDPIWSLKTYKIKSYVTKEDQPTIYYLEDGPKRGFVKEELMIVPKDTVNLLPK